MYPVESIAEEFLSALRKENTVILQAPPGAGKSTILPLKLIESGLFAGKKILMLEPRRLAARSVAERMSELLDEEPGETVGYRIRFDTLVTKKTKLEVVTEGILTRILQSDPALEEYGAIIFDEFHERSLHADLGLALTRQVQQTLRDDLRLIIMSATLDIGNLSGMLKAPVIVSEGRQYPVDVLYLGEDQTKGIEKNVASAIRKAIREYEGDILVFLPGAPEIKRVEEELSDVSGIVIHQLFGDLSMKEQRAAILPDRQGQRKVVLSTSIAETSLTIEGITVVIDSGYSRTNKFDPSTGLNRLVTNRVSKDIADQRAGRAGRLRAGTCFRIWSEHQQLHLNAHRSPEIIEADLSPLVLDLAKWGNMNIKNYDWLTFPPSASINNANELLQKLDAIENGKITAIGKEMARMPAHPRIAHMLLKSEKEEKALAADLAALLDEKDPLKGESINISLRIEELRKFRRKERTNAFIPALQRIEKSARHWCSLIQSQPSISSINDYTVGKLLSMAYPERIAKKVSGNRYRLANGKFGMLPEQDLLESEEWISIATMDASRESGKIYYAAPLNASDVKELARAETFVGWNEEKEMIEAREDLKIGPLIISSKMVKEISEVQRVKVLSELIQSTEGRILNWTDEALQLMARVNSLRLWRTNEEWPDVTLKSLLSDTSWIEPYFQNIRKKNELEKLSLYEIIKNSLPWELQGKLDGYAPSKIKVPSGSMIRLSYSDDGKAPVLAVRLQELFGMLDTPTVNEGKIKILVHLLSPGYKPVQVTQDLRSFWTTTYHEVRKELRLRYPKHSWPEDPFTAQAVRKGKSSID